MLFQVSSKNLNSHMSLKFRQTGQASRADVNERDLRRELDKREEEFVRQKEKGMKRVEEEEKKVEVRLLTNAPSGPNGEILSKYDDADVVDSDEDLDSSR